MWLSFFGFHIAIEGMGVKSEEECLESELQWLLSFSLPGIIERITAKLHRCARSLSQPSNKDFVNNVDTLALSSSSNDHLKGFITITGSKITKGELQIKIPNYNRGNLFRTAIAPSNPYHLAQVQQAESYALLALKSIESYGRSFTMSSALELLGSISKYAYRSRSALVQVSEELVFPCKICNPNHFNPELPEDLIVDFYVSHSTVVCAVSALQLSNVPPDQNPPPMKFTLLPGMSRKESRVVKYKEKYATIIDTVALDSHFPVLSAAVDDFTIIEDLCRKLIAQLDLFANFAN